MATTKSKSKASPTADRSDENAAEPVAKSLTVIESKASPAADRSDEKAAEPVVKSLIVTARVDGFRRSGRAWSATPTTVSADDFTPEEIERLLSEPMLEVVTVADEAI